MMKNLTYFVIVLGSVLCLWRQAEAAKSQIKGDPELMWLNPLGKEDIENNAYNRCLLIKTLKPGVEKASQSRKNFYDTMSQYAANLYAQSIKIAAYLDEEKEAKKGIADKELTNEQDILEHEIIGRLGEITRRINIINSFEAGRVMLEDLWAIKTQFKDDAYSQFMAFTNGEYDFTTDCEVLKEKK